MAYHKRHEERKKSNRLIGLIVAALAAAFALGIFIRQGMF